ncbi:hypothetical protein B296_00047196 [Ensete ventricosum]|uniref:Uncharacterized protein n=1 Tax=Ensete ventricosum TaxID=4639 RepID=A0A426XZK2_ENSVE|nr:hypothetical protein B296_00047196 [Ensete ventricosum]
MEERSKSEAPTRSRFVAPDEVGDHIECTGASCRSCTAVLVADCIALGCCPCAVVNMLALTLVKVPWVVSRRCLAMLKRKGGSLRRRRVRDEGGEVEKMTEVVVVVKGREGRNLEKIQEWEEEGGIWGTREGENGRGGPRFEADKVWMELYQIGHWGFGRLSFSGTQGRSARDAPATSGE